MQIQFAMLIFLEIEDLIDQSLQDPNIFRGNAQQGFLLACEVMGPR